ncbi:ribosome maturation factor RimM [Marinimicrobium alkaliphilum]|uniref:ribosome maturation factor RimM n=1 Tax=Marinimicrobium alkaliphilum TaxID=2202654 RepID=UPI000DB9A44C|nr:ribosome maturation factor RimM [Marinimicrobium alkaliphilum]
MSTQSSGLVDVGRVAAVYGVKGWVKIHPFTETAEAIFDYQPWQLKTAHGVKPVVIDEWRPHGKGYVAHIEGVDDRDQAALFTGNIIAVERSQLPALTEGEFYWRDLEGLSVYSVFEGSRQRLGRVTKLLETGANDVLVVAPDADSVDQRERLIPYVPETYVVRVDLDAGELDADWDPEF